MNINHLSMQAKKNIDTYIYGCIYSFVVKFGKLFPTADAIPHSTHKSKMQRNICIRDCRVKEMDAMPSINLRVHAMSIKLFFFSFSFVVQIFVSCSNAIIWKKSYSILFDFVRSNRAHKLTRISHVTCNHDLSLMTMLRMMVWVFHVSKVALNFYQQLALFSALAPKKIIFSTLKNIYKISCIQRRFLVERIFAKLHTELQRIGFTIMIKHDELREMNRK